MALFEDEDLEEEEIEDSNKYLDNTEEGMELIKSMLGRHDETGKIGEFEHIINADIFPILAELELNNELEIYRMLIKISDKIKEQQKIHILEGKKIIGVGGKFSAGKSCFINSITEADLPEGQRPTTSIATYIVSSGTKSNIAISNSDKNIRLDDEAVLALTHKFYERYKIGFSRLIKNLVIYTPQFTYSNVAILDTPGYSKSDSAKQDDVTDAELARNQLKSVDYLIWLVDAVQGVITQKDLEFISSLNISTKILVVFTKAGLESESNLEKKIKQAKQLLSGINKEIYDVIAYDSMEKTTIIGEGVLESYLSMVNESKIDEDEIISQLKSIDTQLNDQVEGQILDTNRVLQKCENILINTNNIEHISSVVEESGRCKRLLMNLNKDKKELHAKFEQLLSIAMTMKAVK